MSETDSRDISRREKVEAIVDVVQFKPQFAAAIVVLGLVAAVLEGVGLSFILPIIELIQTDEPVREAEGVLSLFVTAYQWVGLPFTLGFVVVGVATVIFVRYTVSFIVAWFREALRTYYIRDLQLRAFDNALGARAEYFDEEGSDDILNAIVTQTYYAGRVIQRFVVLFEELFLSLVYVIIALAIAPVLTVFGIGVLGGLTVLLRGVIDPGYKVGDVVADANQQRQEAAQAGTQGIRTVRIFGLTDELYRDFVDAVNQYTDARITLRRNEAAIENFYNLGVAISVFVMIYLAITFANLSVGALGVFLFAMFQLGPRVSRMNQKFYQLENDLPHLVRSQEFIRKLEQKREPAGGDRPAPDEIDHIEFRDVGFAYDDQEEVLEDLTFEVGKGEFVAFVGQSGAGKSTIVSLLTRLYELDEGEIRVDGIPLDRIDVDEWRDKIAVVRQDPFIFNDTLRYNLSIGDRDVTWAQLDRACEIARVDEFFDDLPDGYDTVLGDNGVRLSGGQKQRVALARALIKDADLLILDEATSDLDSNLEREVQAGIETMDRDYATIAIAHRLSTVQNADRIYTIDDGEIVETGTHEELLNADGEYADLYAIQSTN